ncbi:MAG: hypothetical protein ACT4OP_11190 [Actinomycetota bacterium]
MSDNLKGSAIRGMTRPSRRYGKGRVCAYKGCETRLSQYNRRELCYAHAPVHFPRVRGRILPEGT